ncbi:MAG: HAMP domain-containing histidine kinase [Desulfobacterales bacterium]|nr:HAMP domain-containing histidine kinase [Desulfobacterales bacterium]
MHSFENQLEKEIILKQSNKIISIPYILELLNSIPVILIILNKNRKAIFANYKLIEFLGIDKQEYNDKILGLAPGNIFRCQHVESGGKCGSTEFCRYCGASNAILCCLQGNSDSQECRLLRRGEYEFEALDLLVWTHPFKIDEEYHVLFSVVNVSDMKRRKALERIFFHDILNSVGAMGNFLEMMIYGIKKPDKENLIRIYDYSLSIADEIHAQKYLAQAENNDLTISCADINSQELLKKIVDRYKNHKTAKNRYINIDTQSENIAFRNDPIILGRIIGNLIKNAFEAIKEGESVTISSRLNGSNIEIWIHNPTFISKDIQLQLFKRSFSTKGKDRGLGLYSIRLLTERYLKGKVHFKTSEEEGTTFTAIYPLDIESLI